MKITLEEVIKQFDKKIERAIRNNAFIVRDIEDVKQDIYMAMVRRKYLKKYNPKYALSTYVYTFVRNYCRNMRRDHLLVKNQAMKDICSIDNLPNRAEYLLFVNPNILKEIEWAEFIGKVYKDVENNDFYSVRKFRGKVDLKTVIKLLLSGYNTLEIARKTGVSWTSIDKKFGKLAKRNWIKEYAPSKV